MAYTEHRSSGGGLLVVFMENPNTQVMPAGEFKNRCLALMDEVNEMGVEIIITKHGKPVSRLVPMDDSIPQIWGLYRDQIRITGDIMESPVPADEWEAISHPDRVLDPDLT